MLADAAGGAEVGGFGYTSMYPLLFFFFFFSFFKLVWRAAGLWRWGAFSAGVVLGVWRRQVAGGVLVVLGVLRVLVVLGVWRAWCWGCCGGGEWVGPWGAGEGGEWVGGGFW